MLSNKEIRALSREQLKGHWLKFALINGSMSNNVGDNLNQ